MEMLTLSFALKFPKDLVILWALKRIFGSFLFAINTTLFSN
jgi:hypothetical protein